MGNKTSSFRGAWGGQPRVPCGGSALRSQSHRRLTYKSPRSQVHYSIPLPSIHALPSTQGRAQECMAMAEVISRCQLKSFSHPWGFLCSGSRICGSIGVCDIGFLWNNSVFLRETVCLCCCLHEAVKRWLSVDLLFFFKNGHSSRITYFQPEGIHWAHYSPSTNPWEGQYFPLLLGRCEKNQWCRQEITPSKGKSIAWAFGRNEAKRKGRGHFVQVSLTSSAPPPPAALGSCSPHFSEQDPRHAWWGTPPMAPYSSNVSHCAYWVSTRPPICHGDRGIWFPTPSTSAGAMTLQNR